MRTFTDEEFTGYTFQCETTSANVGFKHVCRVFDNNNTEIKEAKSVINWGNRTWESYQYASVYEQSKSLLADILAGTKKPEIDFDFLYTLANYGYISDYGDLENGETVIIFDSWTEARGREEYNKDTNSWEVVSRSVYAKLCDLAEQNRLKPLINNTIKNVDFVFSDEYQKCWECGTVHNTFYGELTYVEDEDMLLCDKCINSPDRIEGLIERAKTDFRLALKPTIDQNIIADLGYSLVTDDTFSFDSEFWGATYITEERVADFIEKYNGFVQIYEVAQFVTPFQIWVADDRLDEAKNDLLG